MLRFRSEREKELLETRVIDAAGSYRPRYRNQAGNGVYCIPCTGWTCASQATCAAP